QTTMVFKNILNEPQVTKANSSIFKMVSALETVFLRHKWHQPLETKVGQKELSIQDSMKYIQDNLSYRKQIKFSELFQSPDKLSIITTFLAILELMKQNEIKCLQEEHFSEIRLSLLEESS